MEKNMQKLIEEATTGLKIEIDALVVEGIKNLKALHKTNADNIERLEKENSTILALLDNAEYNNIKWSRTTDSGGKTIIDLNSIFPGYRNLTGIY